MHSVSLSISQSIGVPPAKMAALAVATKVFVGTITSLFLTFKNLRQISRALEHELVASANFVPVYLANFSSNILVYGPKINLPDLKISFCALVMNLVCLLSKYGFVDGIIFIYLCIWVLILLLFF